MLKKLSSNNQNFKTLVFKPSFNLIVADRTDTSTKKDTRNGLGKSTFIEILHFCLGADYSKMKSLKAPELKSWEFYLDLEIGKRNLRITRSLEIPARVLISGDIENLGFGSPSTEVTNSLVMAESTLNNLLGFLYFGLKKSDGISDLKYSPSFRSLISYFIRRGPSSYIDPFIHFPTQKDYDKQIQNAFLLGLNWQNATKLQMFKEKEKELTNKAKQAKQGILPGTQGKKSELEALRVTLRQDITKQEIQLSEFNINPDYKETEFQMTQITKQLHHLSEENIQDNRIRTFYVDSYLEEDEPDANDLLKVYEQLKIDIPEIVTRRFSEVEAFHKKLIQNRKSFLEQEVKLIDERVSLREKQKEDLALARAKLMQLLRTTGALEEYTQLAEKLNEKKSALKTIENQIALITQINKDQSTLRLNKEVHYQQAQNDFDERQEIREEAIEKFNNNSQALYKAPGQLLIEFREKGYSFGIQIARNKSEGVGHMKVLCYDLTIEQLWQARKSGPDYLVHDSTIFDGVDERQRASALELLVNQTNTLNFQYIATINTDMIPFSQLDPAFDINEHIICRLTDSGETGGLLGFRLKSTESSMEIDEPAEIDEELE